MNETTITEKPKTVEETISLLAKHTDLLEQISIDLDKAVHSYLNHDARMELTGYSVELDNRRNDGSYLLTKDGQIAHVQDSGGNVIREFHKLSEEGNARATGELKQLIKKVNALGRLALKVDFDREVLSEKEKAALSDLPVIIEGATHVLAKAIQNTRAEGEPVKDLEQFKMDHDDLVQLHQDIGNAAINLIEHNRQDALLARRAKLRTDEARDAHKTEKWERGMAFLKESRDHAANLSPSFRDREAERAKSRIESSDLKILGDEAIAADKAKGRGQVK